MTDFNNPDRSVEDQLSDYGDVLRAHLDGATETATKPGGMFLVGSAPVAAAVSPKRSMNRPVIAIVSIAAAVLLFVGVIVPGLTNDPNNSITTTGPDVANQPQDLDGADSDGSDTIGEKAAAGEDAADAEVKEADDVDWSGFTVGVATDKSSDSPESDEKVIEKDAAAAGTLGDAEDKPEGDKPSEEDKAEEDKAEEDKAEEDKAEEDKPAEDKVDPEADRDAAADDGKADEEKTDDGNAECPSEAVVLAGECYLVVAPSCGDLEANPAGDGCLKLVGAASAAGGCPGAYTLEGDTCVKQLSAGVACSEGVPADGSCLVKQDATGGTDGCADGQLNIGGTCYALSAPSASGCGDLATLASGECRYPVTGESTSECPAGFEPLGGDTCYRYEDGPTYTCEVGNPDGSGGCKSTEPGTPGPDVCPDDVLQDGAGCYVLVGTQEDGTCGDLEELDGQCRKNKSAIQTWTCSDGKTVYENACYVYTDAVATCAAGEPVDGGATCKNIVAATATSGCPDYALEDAQGCYKTKPATANCGDLAVAPDGVNCKEWVGAATGSGGECAAGFDLVGSYCKKYVDGTPSCSGSELVYDGGKPMCRYTQAAGSASTGCGAGEVEKSGQCYLVVAPSCQDLDVDVFGNGCKKPITDT